MNVNCQLLHTQIPVNEQTRHIVAALKDLGFTGYTQTVDMISYEEEVFHIENPVVTIGDAAIMTLHEISEKLSIFQSVPMTVTLGSVLFTIEDFWG